jgi:hypothetical protein
MRNEVKKFGLDDLTKIYFEYKNCIISVVTLIILSSVFYSIKYSKKKPKFGICLNELKKYLNYFNLILIIIRFKNM